MTLENIAKSGIGILLLLCHMVIASAQETSRGAVQGVVVDAQTGTPVVGAQVRLWRELVPGERNPSNQIVEGTTPLISRLLLLPEVFATDARGRFNALNLDEGSYRLVVVNAQGFSRQEFGQSAQNMRATPQTFGTLGKKFQVSAGKTVVGLEVRLNRTAVIAGRVVDRDGKPVVRLSVQLQPIEYDSDGRRLVGFPSDKTTQSDDRGAYRFYDVPAGRYFVVAGISPNPLDSRSGPILELKQKRYVWTFYPASRSEQDAGIINVKPGAELQGINITVTRQDRLYSIRGRVIDAKTGRAPGNASAVYSYHRLGDGASGSGGPISPDSPADRTRAAYNPIDGSFEFRGMEPGFYNLAFVGTIGNVVSVNDTDVRDVVLTVGGSVTVEGRIRAENASVPTSALRSARVRLIRMPAYGNNTPVPAQPGPDGRFQINDLRLGEYRITASSLPSGLYLKDIRIDGMSVVNSTWVFKGGVVPREIDVLIGSDPGSVSGKVSWAGSPLETSHVVLIPEQRARTDLFKAVTVDRDGVFSFDGVAPGRYRVFAWDRITPNEYYDPAFVGASGDRGAGVTVLANGKVVNLEPSLIQTSTLDQYSN